MIDQIFISFVILGTLIFFVWGKWRYEIVALVSLFFVAFLGLIPLDEIFLGFIHPVVILVIAMLLISAGLINSGAIDIIGRRLKFTNCHPILQLSVLMVFIVSLSAFTNGMGALAFVVPIAIKMARQTKTPISMFLMPLAFGSHFGGGITLIGSVSNIIVSGIRAEEIAPFNFFDFASVAFPIAVASIVFIVIVGWRIIPKREAVSSRNEILENYITELSVAEDSPVIGKTIKEFQDFSKENFTVIAMVRGKKYDNSPLPSIKLKKGDVLIIETETSSLEALITNIRLDLVHKKDFKEEERNMKNCEIAEIIVSDSSYLIGETAKDLNLRDNYKINFLAFHRSGEKVNNRLSEVIFKAGDVLVIQGHSDNIGEFVKNFLLFSLKSKDFHFEGNKESAFFAVGIFLTAILISIFSLLPIHFIFAVAAMIMIASGLVSFQRMNGVIDFSMIVILAVMIQLGTIFYQTGAASSVANFLFSFESMSLEIAFAIIFISSIWLSDVLSNATVAVLLAPIALSIAQQFQVSPDPFLIAVAIGSGSSYLTPIGHQSNIFIMGIGGYRFSDYWRLGLPLEIITFVIGIILIPKFWPF
jgi:di/tricarboxylate transporter